MMDSKEAGFYASLLNVLTENASFEDKERVAQWIDSDQETERCLKRSRLRCILIQNFQI